MYKLVALDIDGTLLNSQGIVTIKTIEAIKKAIKNKVLVTISTGRPIQGVHELIKLLNLKSPIITYNGAMICAPTTNEVLYEQNLIKDDAKQIIEFGLKNNTTIIIWSNNQLYVNEINNQVNRYKQISGVEPIVVEDYEKIIEQGITKTIWIDQLNRIDEFKSFLDEKANNSYTYATSRPIFLEFFDQRASKANALKYIGKIFNIKQEEMIAIGDGHNDLPMIEYAGLGVAMGNASDFVKEKANYITLSNDEDGIVRILNEFIFTI